MKALDGGTLVALAAVLVSLVTLFFNQRANKRREQHEDTAKAIGQSGVAAEASDRLIRDLQDEKLEAKKDAAAKRELLHTCQKQCEAWRWWAQLVSRDVDLPAPLAEHRDRLMRGETR